MGGQRPECCVCMAAEAEMVIVPCGHLCLCEAPRQTSTHTPQNIGTFVMALTACLCLPYLQRGCVTLVQG